MDFELTKAQRNIVRAAREFAKAEFPGRALEFDREETFDEAIFQKAAQLGFVGVCIGEAYGGEGLGILESCLILEEFTAVDPGIALAILSSTFGADIIEAFGTEEQKKAYLPPLAEGTAVMGTALTEPNAGSDLASTTTEAVRKDDVFIINGGKVFITNGSRADYLLCFIRTDGDNPNIHQRHSMIMVETNRQGLTVNPLKGKMGMRASNTTEIFFKDVKASCANLIGKQGNGFKQAMYLFDRNRIGVAAQAVGIARAALEESIKYVKDRQVFGASLAVFQATQCRQPPYLVGF